MRTSEERRQDLEANYFAMCLLIPEQFIIEDLRKLNFEIDAESDLNIRSLALRYNVSEQLMCIRIHDILADIRDGEIDAS